MSGIAAPYSTISPEIGALRELRLAPQHQRKEHHDFERYVVFR